MQRWGEFEEERNLKHQWDTVEDVLRFAHRWSNRTVIKSPSVQRVSGDTSPSALTQLDNVAQAAMILAFVDRTLLEVERDVVALYFAPPTAGQKEFCATYVGHRLSEQLSRPKWWVVDVLREWSGAGALHNVDWWAQNLQRNRKTLYTWSRSRDPQSVYSVINRELAVALGKLSDPMYARKWICEDELETA